MLLNSVISFSSPVVLQAANPGCVLEDFVRWYSPRDYVEEVVDKEGNTVTKGELSVRMKIPGNMWVETWETARTVPARRQRRLFDDTKEAEKVIFSSSVFTLGIDTCLGCSYHKWTGRGGEFIHFETTYSTGIS